MKINTQNIVEISQYIKKPKGNPEVKASEVTEGKQEDSVNISQEARDMQQSSQSRCDRLAELKSMVESGKYHVDEHKIADAMLRDAIKNGRLSFDY